MIETAVALAILDVLAGIAFISFLRYNAGEMPRVKYPFAALLASVVFWWLIVAYILCAGARDWYFWVIGDQSEN